MVDYELVKLFITALEAERGCPVQVQVDTPTSVRFANDDTSGREFFGSFSNRSALVARVDGLDIKYVSDVEMIEGEYGSLAALQLKIKGLNALHDYSLRGNLAERAYQLVKDATGIQDLIGDSLSRNFLKIERGNISASRVYQILDGAGMVYLKHNLVARPDGVYDDRTAGGHLARVQETKVASIALVSFK